MLSNSYNVDKVDQLKFDNMAEDWWDPHGPLRTLHHINPVRLRYIEQSVQLHGKQVLDVGCGGGLLSEALAGKNARVTGLDISASAIAAADAHKNRDRLEIEYVVGSAEQFAENHRRRFDLITCMELLEHVPDVPSLLESCARMLKPGGNLFLSTINRSIVSYLTAIIGAEYVLNLLPRGTHDYSRFIRPSELNQWLVQQQFRLIDISGISYVPGINKCIVTGNPAVNYIAHAILVD